MKQVVFLYNELLDENKQKLAKRPLEFICFAYINNATMYYIDKKYVAIRKNELKKTNINNKVYGAMYILDHSEHTLRTLDAVMTCSKAFIGYNHDNDLMHRVKIKSTPIHFKTVEEFLKLRYNEMEEIDVITYLGNINNNVIKTNVLNTVRNREVSGLDINNFINLVLKEKSE